MDWHLDCPSVTRKCPACYPLKVNSTGRSKRVLFCSTAETLFPYWAIQSGAAFLQQLFHIKPLRGASLCLGLPPKAWIWPEGGVRHVGIGWQLPLRYWQHHIIAREVRICKIQGRCHHLPKDSNNSSETTSAVHPQVSGRTTMTAVLSARMLKAP